MSSHSKASPVPPTAAAGDTVSMTPPQSVSASRNGGGPRSGMREARMAAAESEQRDLEFELVKLKNAALQEQIAQLQSATGAASTAASQALIPRIHAGGAKGLNFHFSFTPRLDRAWALPWSALRR